MSYRIQLSLVEELGISSIWDQLWLMCDQQTTQGHISLNENEILYRLQSALLRVRLGPLVAFWNGQQGEMGGTLPTNGLGAFGVVVEMEHSGRQLMT